MIEDRSELEPYQVESGTELLAQNPEIGNIYAGEGMTEKVEQADDDEIVIGTFDDPVRGANEPAYFPITKLYQNTLLVGRTGSGKGTLLNNTLLQLADKGYSFTLLNNISEEINYIQTCLQSTQNAVMRVDMEDETAKFSLFTTYFNEGDEEYEAELEFIGNITIELLKTKSGYLGKRGEEVIRTLTYALTRLDERCTITDLYWLVSDHEERVKFAEDVEGRIADEELVSDLQTVAKSTDSDLAGLEKRVKELASDMYVDTLLFSQNEDAAPLYELIADEKTCLVNTSNSHSGNIVSKGIMAAVKEGKELQREIGGDSSYFLALDDYSIFNDNDGGTVDYLTTMLADSRRLNMGVFVVLLETSMVSDDGERKEMLESIENVFTFSIPSQSEAGRLAQLYNIGGNELTELPMYTFMGRLVTKNGTYTQPFKITTLAKLPPMW